MAEVTINSNLQRQVVNQCEAKIRRLAQDAFVKNKCKRGYRLPSEVDRIRELMQIALGTTEAAILEGVSSELTTGAIADAVLKATVKTK